MMMASLGADRQPKAKEDTANKGEREGQKPSDKAF